MTFIQPPVFDPTQSLSAWNKADHPRESNEGPPPQELPASSGNAPAMEARSPLMSFFDSFLQEQNIKWVLGVGTAIVLGSSLMLVAAHWQQYAPMWKHLIMLGYTTLVAGAGWWSYHKLHLRKTGTTLMTLTVLLLPIMFLALHWVSGNLPLDAHALTQSLTRDGPASPGIGHIALLIVTALVAYLAASRIFRHFLRDDHPTFLASYLLLCLAGVMLPLVPVSMLPISALLLWLIASVGAIKVNRHVFWLVEEHRGPRIIGFFPIALLCGQFLLLFALHMAPHIPLQWMGTGCVLVAATMLITTNTLAKVFEQRTGNLIHPMPIAIIAPLVIGLILCAAGVILSATGFPFSFALAPTAAIATALLLLVARRTQLPAFTWAALLTLTIAYQASPVFFKEAAMHLLDAGARLVQEERLPVAFYGLTYLPLIAGLMVTATIAARRNLRYIAGPARVYSVALSIFLLALAMGHVKALAPVAIAMVFVFALQTRLYRQPRLALPAIAAFLLAAFAITDFIPAMELATPAPESRLLAMIAAAAALLIAGPFIDRRLDGMIVRVAGDESNSLATSITRFSPCETASRWLAVALAVCLPFTRPGPLYNAIENLWPLWIIAAAATVLLVAGHALRRTSAPLGLVAVVLAQVVVLLLILSSALTITTIISTAMLALVAQWLIARWLLWHDAWRISQTFANPLEATSHLALALGLIVLGILLPAAEMFTPLMSTDFTPWWIARLMLIAWGFAAAIHRRDASQAKVAFIAVLASAGSRWLMVTGFDGATWLPALWAAIAAVALMITQVIYRKGNDILKLIVGRPVERLALFVLATITLVSLGIFTLPLRVAAIIALAGLMAMGIFRRSQLTRICCFILVNWQLLAFAIVLLGSDQFVTLLDLNLTTLRPIALPLALLAALSVHFWLLVRNPLTHASRDLITGQRILLALVSCVCLACSATYPNLITSDFLLAGVAFAMLIFAQLRVACRNQNEGDVWCAQVLAGAAVAYFAWHGIITFGSGMSMSMYITLAVGVALALIAKACLPFERTRIITGPFQRTGIIMPAIAVAIGVLHHLNDTAHAWIGFNSLALFLAGGFYFWHGLETKRRRFIAAAAIIFNIALAMLWNELKLSDPQFFMIPIGMTILALTRLLRKEIPTEMREPLYYCGALTILVSPVFHILGDGSWVHLLSLMVLSVMVIFAAIGFRVRPLVYAGTAFLLADIVAMVVVGSISHPSLLWIAGIGLGGGVVALGALAERNREQLLARLRQVSATLAAWE